MQRRIKGKNEFSYENEATGSYLVISPEDSDTLIDYQVEMISKNPNPSILPISVRRKDNKVKIYYNITSKTSLAQMFKRKFEKNEFINILQSISTVIIESKNYFLSDNCFIVDEELIFLSPDTLNVSLVYLPIKSDSDVNSDYKDFLIKVVVNTADLVQTNDNIFQRILSFAKSDNFNIAEFNKFLSGMKETNTNSKRIGQTENSKTPNMDNRIMPDESTELKNNEDRNSDNKNSRNFKPIIQNNTRDNISPEPPIVKIPGKEGNRANIPTAVPKVQAQPKPKKSKLNVSGMNSSGSAHSNKLKTKILVIGAAIQLFILIVFGLIAMKMDVKALGNDTTTTYFALFIIAAAASFLVWRKILEKMRAVPDTSSNTDERSAPAKINQNVINMDKFEYRKVNYKPAAHEMHNRDSISTDDNLNINNSDCTEPLESFAGCDDTVILEHSKERYPLLNTIKDGVPNTIVINKANFTIGRLKGQVDYVHTNNAIGKVHAEIISKNGLYFIKDMNSRNGTYINGTKMESNKEYQINNNDKISFANTEFTFTIP